MRDAASEWVYTPTAWIAAIRTKMVGCHASLFACAFLCWHVSLLLCMLLHAGCLTNISLDTELTGQEFSENLANVTFQQLQPCMKKVLTFGQIKTKIVYSAQKTLLD